MTDVTRDAVLMERIRRSHSCRRERRVLGEGGEEGFQLDFRAERICWPFCSNVAETLLCMPQMVCRHWRPGLKRSVRVRSPFRHLPWASAGNVHVGHDHVTPIAWLRACPSAGARRADCGNMPVASDRHPLLLLLLPTSEVAWENLFHYISLDKSILPRT
jgi:hypothetical protein